MTALRPTEVHRASITHNLIAMAAAADLYIPIWRPEEMDITTAAQLLPLLRDGWLRLHAEPEKCRALNPENVWGTYAGLVRFVEAYIAACIANPDAVISVSR